MSDFARGYGGLTLSFADRTTLRTKADDLIAAMNLDDTVQGLGADVYDFLEEALSDSSGDKLPEVDDSVWSWIIGAKDVNAGQGFFGDFINDYTAAQHKAAPLGTAFP